MGYLLPFDMNRGGEAASMRTAATVAGPSGKGGPIAAVSKGGGSKGGKGYFRVITKGKFKGQVLFCYGTYADVHKQLIDKQAEQQSTGDKTVFGEFLSELNGGADQTNNISGTGPLEDASPQHDPSTGTSTYDVFGHPIQVYGSTQNVAGVVNGASTSPISSGNVEEHLAQLIYAAHGFLDSQGNSNSSRGVTTSVNDFQSHVPTWNTSGDSHEISLEFASLVLHNMQQALIHRGVQEKSAVDDTVRLLAKTILERFPKTDMEEGASFGLNEVRPLAFEHENADGSITRAMSAQEDDGSVAGTIKTRRGYGSPILGTDSSDAQLRGEESDPHSIPKDIPADGGLSADPDDVDDINNEEVSLSTRIDRLAKVISSRWVQILAQYKERGDSDSITNEFTEKEGIVSAALKIMSTRLDGAQGKSYTIDKDGQVVEKSDPSEVLTPSLSNFQKSSPELLIAVRGANSVADALGITRDTVIPHIIDLLKDVLEAGTREITTEVPNPQYALKPPKVKPLSAMPGARFNLKIEDSAPAGPSSVSAPPVGYSATVAWNDPRAQSVNPLHRDTYITPYLKKETTQESYGRTPFYQEYLKSAGLLPDSADAEVGGMYARPPNIAAPSFFDSLLLYRLTPNSNSIELSSHGQNGTGWQDIPDLGANDQQRLMIGLRAKSDTDYKNWQKENSDLIQYADPWREIYHAGGLIDQLVRVVDLVNDRKANFARINAGKALDFKSQTPGFTHEQIEQLRNDKVESTGLSIRDTAEGLLAKISAIITGSQYENIKTAQKAIIARLALTSGSASSVNASDSGDGLSSNMSELAQAGVMGSASDGAELSKWLLPDTVGEGGISSPNSLTVQQKTDISQWNNNYIKTLRMKNRGFNLGSTSLGGSGGFVSGDLSQVSTELTYNMEDVARILLGKKVTFENILEKRRDSHADPFNENGSLRKIHDGVLDWFAKNQGKMPVEKFAELLDKQKNNLFGVQESDPKKKIHDIIGEAVMIAQECQRSGTTIIPISSLTSFIPELGEVSTDPHVKNDRIHSGARSSSTVPFCIYVKGNPEWLHIQNRISFFEDPVVNIETLSESLNKFLFGDSGVPQKNPYYKDEHGSIIYNQEFESAIKVLTSQLKLYGINSGTIFSKNIDYVDLHHICGVGNAQTRLTLTALQPLLTELRTASEAKINTIRELAESLHSRYEDVPLALIVAEDPFIADPLLNSTSQYFTSSQDLLTEHLRQIAKDNNIYPTVKIIRIPSLQKYSEGAARDTSYSTSKKDAIRKYIANLTPDQRQSIVSDPFSVAAEKMTSEQIVDELEKTDINSPQGKVSTLFDQDFPKTFSSSDQKAPPEILFLSGNAQEILHQQGSAIVGIQEISEENAKTLFSSTYMKQEKPTVVITRSQLEAMRPRDPIRVAQDFVRNNPHLKFIFVGQFQKGINFSGTDSQRVCFIHPHSPTLTIGSTFKNPSMEKQIQENISHGIILGTNNPIYSGSFIPQINSSAISNANIASNFNESMQKRTEKPYSYEPQSVAWQDRFLPSSDNGLGIGHNDGSECVVSLFAPWVRALAGGVKSTYQIPRSDQGNVGTPGSPISRITSFDISNMSPQYGATHKKTWGSPFQILQRQKILAGNMQRAISTMGIVGDVIANGHEAAAANDMMLFGKRLFVMKSAFTPPFNPPAKVQYVATRSLGKKVLEKTNIGLYPVNARSGNWALLNNKILNRTQSTQLPTMLAGQTVYAPNTSDKNTVSMSPKRNYSWRSFFQSDLPGTFADYEGSYDDRMRESGARDQIVGLDSWNQLSDGNSTGAFDGLITRAAPTRIAQWGTARDATMWAPLKASNRGATHAMSITSAHFPGLRVHVDYKHGIMPGTGSEYEPLTGPKSHALLKLYKTNQSQWDDDIPLMSIPVHMETPLGENKLSDAGFHYRIFYRAVTDLAVRMISAYAAKKFADLNASSNQGTIQQTRQQDEVFPRGEWPQFSSQAATGPAKALIYDDNIVEDPDSKSLSEMLLESYTKQELAQGVGSGTGLAVRDSNSRKKNSLKYLYERLLPQIYREYLPEETVITPQKVEFSSAQQVPLLQRPAVSIDDDVDSSNTQPDDTLKVQTPIPTQSNNTQSDDTLSVQIPITTQSGIITGYKKESLDTLAHDIRTEIESRVNDAKARETTIWGIDNNGEITIVAKYNPLELKNQHAWHEEIAAKLQASTQEAKTRLQQVLRFDAAVMIVMSRFHSQKFSQLSRAHPDYEFAHRGNQGDAETFVNTYRAQIPDSISSQKFSPRMTLGGRIKLRDTSVDIGTGPISQLLNPSDKAEAATEASASAPEADKKNTDAYPAKDIEQPQLRTASGRLYGDITDPPTYETLREDTVKNIDEIIDDLILKMEKVKNAKSTDSIKIGMDSDGKHVILPEGSSRDRSKKIARLLDHVEQIIEYLEKLKKENSTKSRKIALSFAVYPKNVLKKKLYLLKGVLGK